MNKKLISFYVSLAAVAILAAYLWAVQGGAQPPTLQQLVQGFKLDRQVAEQSMAVLTQKPHPFGSQRQQEIIEWLMNKLERAGLAPYKQSFSANTPNPILLQNPHAPAPLVLEKSGANVFVRIRLTQHSSCIVLMGGHTDTKIVAGGDYLGANDSGSSTIGLLQVAQYLHQGREIIRSSLAPICDIGIFWFDGEEAVLSGWHDGRYRHPAKIIDNRYGSRFAANQATKSPEAPPLASSKIKALVLMDMIGSEGLKITLEKPTPHYLIEKVRFWDSLLFEKSILQPKLHGGIEDDHVSFRDIGVDSINLIDFYNTAHWHRFSDTSDFIDYSSIERASQLGLALVLDLISEAKNP